MADFSMQTGPKSKWIAAPHVLTLRLLSAVESHIMCGYFSNYYYFSVTVVNVKLFGAVG